MGRLLRVTIVTLVAAGIATGTARAQAPSAPATAVDAVPATPPASAAPACAPPLTIEPTTEASIAAVTSVAIDHARKPCAVSRK